MCRICKIILLTVNYFCAIYFGVKKETNLSSCERREVLYKHVSLTHWMRSGWRPNAVQPVINKCDVNPNVGELPPELRRLVPREKLGEYTARFHEILWDFIVDNYYTIKNSPVETLVQLTPAADLFGTHCTVEYCGIDGAGRRKWHGALGMVCRISFPKIGADYAWKIFFPMAKIPSGHGIWFEVPAAFAASRSEPRDNSHVYMASFLGDGYMLSNWCWKKISDMRVGRHNSNKIFETASCENVPRNYANGRRIDYGKTYMTVYGAAPYRVRKLVRTLINHSARQDSAEINMLFARNRDNFIRRKELINAVEIACFMSSLRGKYEIQKFIADQFHNQK